MDQSPVPSNQQSDQVNSLDVAFEINKILDCGLDKDTLSICIALLESGINPEALAVVIKKLRKEAAKSKAISQQQEQDIFPDPSRKQN